MNGDLIRKEPVIIVSTFEKWLRWMMIGLLIIDIGLTFMLMVQLNRNAELILRSQSLDCRDLVLRGIELDPHGSCMDREVLEYYDPKTGRSR